MKVCSKQVLGRRVRWFWNRPRAVPVPVDGEIVSVSGPYFHCDCGRIHNDYEGTEPTFAIQAEHVELKADDGQIWTGVPFAHLEPVTGRW